ncbi:MAG: hypothetical protein Q4F95_16335 [Oscillospiraceae bacterium]|nr:hypothetical protein [Oscillospiraceae bacterium]
MDENTKKLISDWEKESDKEKHRDINEFINTLKDRIKDTAEERFKEELNRMMIVTEIQMMEYKKKKKNIRILKFEQNENKQVNSKIKKVIKSKKINNGH